MSVQPTAAPIIFDTRASASSSVITARRLTTCSIGCVRAVMTLEEALARVSKMIGAAVGWTDIQAFLLSHAEPALRRSALASSFVAALELARRGALDLQQEDSFAPLYLRAKP